MRSLKGAKFCTRGGGGRHTTFAPGLNLSPWAAYSMQRKRKCCPAPIFPQTLLACAGRNGVPKGGSMHNVLQGALLSPPLRTHYLHASLCACCMSLQLSVQLSRVTLSRWRFWFDGQKSHCAPLLVFCPSSSRHLILPWPLLPVGAHAWASLPPSILFLASLIRGSRNPVAQEGKAQLFPNEKNLLKILPWQRQE